MRWRGFLLLTAATVLETFNCRVYNFRGKQFSISREYFHMSKYRLNCNKTRWFFFNSFWWVHIDACLSIWTVNVHIGNVSIFTHAMYFAGRCYTTLKLLFQAGIVVLITTLHLFWILLCFISIFSKRSGCQDLRNLFIFWPFWVKIMCSVFTRILFNAISYIFSQIWLQPISYRKSLTNIKYCRTFCLNLISSVGRMHGGQFVGWV